MAKIAKTVKNDLSTLKQSCVGKKMKGFKFADCKSAHWCSEMEDFIGQEGEIIAYNEAWNYFTVKFSNASEHWAYPATKALKHIVEETKVVEKNVLEEAIDDTYTAMLKEEIADLSAKLDGAYKEQEQMLKELKRWVDAFPYAFKQLEEHAGEITVEDVTYHVKLISKIMEHKFGYKPKMVEL
jgi:hypothetical protein